MSTPNAPAALVIDVHCHAGLGDGLTAPWDTEARLEPYLRRAEAAGIDVTVVFPVFNSDYAAANERLARIVARLPHRLIGFAAIDPVRDVGRTERMIGRAVEVHGFRGIKVHGQDSFPGRRLCEAAQRWSVPILVDVIRRPGRIEMLAGQYPDVNFIVPHLGGFADDWDVHRQVIDHMVRWPNVYADTSGVRYFDALVEAVRRAGPGKLLFGSDGPQLHPGVELHKVRMLHLPPSAQAQVLGKTAARLLRISRSPRPKSAQSSRYPRGSTARPLNTSTLR
jgi:predicted TIM-barrel fold metal-dependent hydrolase